MINRYSIALMVFVLSFVGALASAPQTYAVSEFDNEPRVTDNLIIKGTGNETSERNHTNDWSTVIFGESSSCSQTQKTSWSNKTYWAVVKEYTANNAYQINVHWSEGQNPGAGSSAFVNTGVSRILAVNSGTVPLNTATINYWNNTAYITCYSPSYDQLALSTFYYAPYEANNENRKELFLSTFAHAPVEGYEGEGIPGESVPADVFYPEFTYTKLGKKITASYEDNIPYEGKSLVSLTWTLSQDMDESTGTDYEMIDTKTMGYDGIYEFNVSNTGNYILSLGYSIRAPGILPEDMEVQPRIQGILIDGKSETLSTTDSDCTGTLCQEKTLWVECLTETFPFLNVAGCTANMGSLVEILTFNAISFGTPFKFDEQCHTLGTIGTWLNLEGQDRVVCPAISSEVRSVITPFITFAFSLMGVKYITSRMEGYRNG